MERGPNRQRLIYNHDPLPTIYAIGDVHGCYKYLIEAEERIRQEAGTSRFGQAIVLLGDLVDRGGSSAQVLEHLCDAKSAGMRRVVLCGNHDDLFLKFIKDPKRHAEWIEFGGDTTLMSYGIEREEVMRLIRKPDALRKLLLDAIPPAHIEFLESLPTCLKVGQFLFTHAGVKPGVPLADQTDHDLMWIREPFLSKGPQLPITVVHGHTPSLDPVFENGRIGIDTGAYTTGTLTVLKVSNGEATVLG